MLGNSFFITNSSNPNTPAETWTLVYSKNTGGNYSYSAGWGKYRIEISGGGGSGGAGSAWHDDYRNYAYNGSKGEYILLYKNITHGLTLTFSGKVGTGGASSYADAATHTATAGAAGTGYGNGSKGSARGEEAFNPRAAAGGSGGGSTSFTTDGIMAIAKGGNGGIGSADEIGEMAGGTGGSGGTSNGTGASGGKGVFGYKQAATSGAGGTGYVRIYKSNLKPEPL